MGQALEGRERRVLYNVCCCVPREYSVRALCLSRCRNAMRIRLLGSSPVVAKRDVGLWREKLTLFFRVGSIGKSFNGWLIDFYNQHFFTVVFIRLLREAMRSV